MTHTDVIKKLIGPVRPIGETNADDERLKNLHEMMDVMQFMYWELRSIAANKDAGEYSISLAGKEAHNFLENLK